jgi:HSP20 family protein
VPLTRIKVVQFPWSIRCLHSATDIQILNQRKRMEVVMSVRNMLPRLWRDDRHPLSSLHDEIDELLETWTKDFGFPQMPRMPAQWAKDISPRMNVSETDKELQITAELPGVDQKDIEITLTGGDLLIKGEKKSEIDEKKDERSRSYHRVERSFGSFQRRLSLPYDVDADKVQASFKDGVLTLTLPKPSEVQKSAKKIEIRNEKQIETKRAA